MDAIHYIVHCLWWEKDRNIVLEIDDKTRLNVLYLAEFLFFFMCDDVKVRRDVDLHKFAKDYSL